MKENNRLWISDLTNDTYKNPILFADYSDPDVIRVGDTYYMTASSFNYTPGLPILISKDLVNWELKNYAIENIPFSMYEKPQHSKGVWAPAIRYHHDTFYIYFGMPDNGVFVVHTEDPLGTWSEPVMLLEGKGYIDPCPFWDDDGKAYIIHSYAKSRIGFKSYLGIFEMSEDGIQAIGRDHLLYDGTKTQPTIEGPKVYKRNSNYYIFAPAGGVKYGWQTVLRSNSIEGLFEERIVMHQGNTYINGPHQGALVNTPNGDEWFIHFQDKGLYGRITHLQPVIWKEDWPIIGINADENGCGEPCDIHQKPWVKHPVKPIYLEATDYFDKDSLALQWQWMGNHNEAFYDLLKDKNKGNKSNGYLRLYSLNLTDAEQPVLWDCSQVLTQKIIFPSFKAIIRMNAENLKVNEKAGCVLMGGQYAYLAVKRDQNDFTLVYVESKGDKDRRTDCILMEKKLPNHLQWIQLFLSFSEEDKSVEMKYYLEENKVKNQSIDENCFQQFGQGFKPTDHTWVGAKVGLFAMADGLDKDKGFADFDYIKVIR